MTLLKVFQRIIQKSIFRKLHTEICDTQKSSREALFGIKVLMQRCLNMNRDINVSFINFVEVHGQTRNDKLLDILKTKHKDGRNSKAIFLETIFGSTEGVTKISVPANNLRELEDIVIVVKFFKISNKLLKIVTTFTKMKIIEYSKLTINIPNNPNETLIISDSQI